MTLSLPLTLLVHSQDVTVKVILQFCLYMTRPAKVLWCSHLNPFLIEQREQLVHSAGGFRKIPQFLYPVFYSHIQRHFNRVFVTLTEQEMKKKKFSLKLKNEFIGNETNPHKGFASTLLGLVLLHWHHVMIIIMSKENVESPNWDSICR